MMSGRTLKPNYVGGRYAQVTLCRDGEMSYRKVHRLVCEAFHGPCPPDCTQVRHRDGNEKNNYFDNLRWATVADNEEDKKLHGTHQKGAAHAHAVFTEDQIRELFSDFWRESAGRTRAVRKGFLTDMSRKYDVTISAVENVVYERWWTHITGAIRAQH